MAPSEAPTTGILPPISIPTDLATPPLILGRITSMHKSTIHQQLHTSSGIRYWSSSDPAIAIEPSSAPTRHFSCLLPAEFLLHSPCNRVVRRPRLYGCRRRYAYGHLHAQRPATPCTTAGFFFADILMYLQSYIYHYLNNLYGPLAQWLWLSLVPFKSSV